MEDIMGNTGASDRDDDSSHYKTDLLLIKKFLLEFTVGIEDIYTYKIALRKVKNRAAKEVEVKLDDMTDFNRGEMEPVCKRIEKNGKRYIEIISQACDEILANDEELPPDPNVIGDSIDILQRQREAQNENLRRQFEAQQVEERNGAEEQMNGGGVDRDGQDENNGPPEISFPIALIRRYELRILPRSLGNGGPPNSASLRHIRSAAIGKLVRIKGMITRCSEVKPHCEVSVQ